MHKEGIPQQFARSWASDSPLDNRARCDQTLATWRVCYSRIFSMWKTSIRRARNLTEVSVCCCLCCGMCVRLLESVMFALHDRENHSVIRELLTTLSIASGYTWWSTAERSWSCGEAIAWVLFALFEEVVVIVHAPGSVERGSRVCSVDHISRERGAIYTSRHGWRVIWTFPCAHNCAISLKKTMLRSRDCVLLRICRLKIVWNHKPVFCSFDGSRWSVTYTLN